MGSKTWNSLASNFDEEVLELAAHDFRGTLKREIARIARGKRTAADLGCGPGSLLPLLCDHFSKVHAVDYAAKLIELAQQRYELDKVKYRVHDLAGRKALPFTVDVSFSVNALITENEKDRRQMAKTLWRTTRKKGACFVVVPSMESTLHVYQALLRCLRRDGMSQRRAQAAVDRIYKREVLSPKGGIVNIGGAPTKCYTREELELLLSEAGFAVEKIERVEYPWAEEIDHAPRWLKNPYPWDWLAIGHKA